MLSARVIRWRPVAAAAILGAAILAATFFAAPAYAKEADLPRQSRPNPCAGAPNKFCGLIKVKQGIIPFVANEIVFIPPEVREIVPRLVGITAGVTVLDIKKAKHPKKAGKKKKRRAEAKAIKGCKADIINAPFGSLLIEIDLAGSTVAVIFPEGGAPGFMNASIFAFGVPTLGARVTKGANGKSRFAVGKKLWVAKCVRPRFKTTPVIPF